MNVVSVLIFKLLFDLGDTKSYDISLFDELSDSEDEKARVKEEKAKKAQKAKAEKPKGKKRCKKTNVNNSLIILPVDRFKRR